MYDYIKGLKEEGLLNDKEQEIVTDFSLGMRGTVYEDTLAHEPGTPCDSPVPGMPQLPTVLALSVRFKVIIMQCLKIRLVL